jgi:ABC-2 type transport system ATP-binding protein
MEAIRILDVTKTFGTTTAVDNLSLAVPEGSIYGFIGPNGSGKTTTMRMIVGIFHPDRGSVRVFGKEMREAGSGLIGYLPEERGLYRKMAVRPLLEFHGELRAGRNVSGEVNAWLQKLDLADCDEPFTGLDPVSAESIRQAILELRRRGTTIVLSTHDMSLAETLCDSIFMIFRGKKVLDGSLAAIQDRYGNDTIRISADNGAAHLNDLPGVEFVRDLGQMQELRMARGCDSHEVLRTLVSRTRVTSYSVSRPSLNDIFVRIAGPDGDAS